MVAMRQMLCRYSSIPSNFKGGGNQKSYKRDAAREHGRDTYTYVYRTVGREGFQNDYVRRTTGYSRRSVKRRVEEGGGPKMGYGWVTVRGMVSAVRVGEGEPI